MRHAPAPALVAVAHGTRNPEGQRCVRELVELVRAARPGIDIRESYVDVQEPELSSALGDVGHAVVVPLLLSTGFHVRHDIAQAVEAHPGTVAAPPLGPDAALVDVLVDRLAVAGLGENDLVVLAGAGSSDPDGASDVERTASMLAARLGRDVRVGYVSAATPKIGEAVAEARERAADRQRVAVASYLLVPGMFHTALADTGADLISDPLGVDERIIDLVLRRYDAAVNRSRA